jgi:hypothetical protein
MPVALMPCIVSTAMPQRSSASRVSPCSRGIFGGVPAGSSCDVGHDSEFRPTVSKYLRVSAEHAEIG